MSYEGNEVFTSDGISNQTDPPSDMKYSSLNKALLNQSGKSLKHKKNSIDYMCNHRMLKDITIKTFIDHR